MSDACEPLREWGGENWRGEEGVGVISFQGVFFLKLEIFHFRMFTWCRFRFFFHSVFVFVWHDIIPIY